MALIVGPQEYSTSDWGKQKSISDVWEGPMDELITQQASIETSYTSTQITPTKGGHGKLTATLTFAPNEDPPAVPTGDLTIEVEWVELRLPVETNPFFDDLTALNKAIIRKGALDGTAYSALPPMAGDLTTAEKLHELIAGGTTEWSTGVPVVRRTTKNASNITRGSAWFRDTPPVEPEGSWEYLKTADRRTKIGNDISQIEEWTGSAAWDADMYPAIP